MNQKQSYVTKAYYQGIQCAEHLTQGLLQLPVLHPEADPRAIGVAIYLLNYYSNDRDCLQMVPTYFHILGMKAPRFIRRFHQNTDENTKTAFRMGLCTGLDNLVRSLDDTLR